ncbi:MAG: efflux RND transporter periplasmic adaptor subunit [Acidobacteria bacterium]|nr:efflux RND transporter periplasmic adaptor subunit [Acidobacteriota bacterium]NIM61874.1 efflux RND transporter periplasmic adaptor subunit [Acidobacteriota bacterium]NIO60831.1 efflux RND transporter periplasmic adaptor subunit [Acidobacteriota bacterium]NIQ31906.1 efflux RND transporter periplasmic adaptor subunit [Acidobacteriota bacterium]NIQ87283.1 efflux RND transporter periplasmic adaptor subunit [Acidobacteriota bacterium]
MKTASRLVAAGLVLTVLACAPPPDRQEVEFRVPVTVREVETGDVEDRVIATGTLRTPETISLRADTAGALRVARAANGRRLAEGDSVEAGQLLAEITGEEVRLAAAADARQQRLAAARRDYETKKALFDEGLISAEALRPFETALADAQLEWERSQLTQNRSRLVTPISGVVLRLARDEQNRPLADGQLVVQGAELAQVAPTRSLVADVDLIGQDLAKVRERLEARVRHSAWGDTRFEGTVIRLAPSLDPMTRTLRAEVAVENPGGELRPGMFVEVTIISERRTDVPVVPREAVTERGGRKVVFVLEGQKVTRRDVALGLGDDDVVEIRQGVQPGERVVVRGIETLQDDQRVRVSGA